MSQSAIEKQYLIGSMGRLYIYLHFKFVGIFMCFHVGKYTALMDPIGVSPLCPLKILHPKVIITEETFAESD